MTVLYDEEEDHTGVDDDAATAAADEQQQQQQQQEEEEEEEEKEEDSQYGTVVTTRACDEDGATPITFVSFELVASMTVLARPCLARGTTVVSLRKVTDGACRALGHWGFQRLEDEGLGI